LNNLKVQLDILIATYSREFPVSIVSLGDLSLRKFERKKNIRQTDGN